jgi:hypothetical protein
VAEYTSTFSTPPRITEFSVTSSYGSNSTGSFICHVNVRAINFPYSLPYSFTDTRKQTLNAIFHEQHARIVNREPSPLRSILQSIRGDETVDVNKPSPVSPQLTARSGQSAQLVQCTHCIRTHVNLHSDFGHPCNGTCFTWSLHDFILRAKEISRAFVYDDSLVSANGL